jgi:hypothetical protein
MGGALWRYGTQEEGCTNHSFIHSFMQALPMSAVAAGKAAKVAVDAAADIRQVAQALAAAAMVAQPTPPAANGHALRASRGLIQCPDSRWG